jgi:hypothetical protein
MDNGCLAAKPGTLRRRHLPLCVLAHGADGPARVWSQSDSCFAHKARFDSSSHAKGHPMNSIVYIVGAVVIIVAILSFIGIA